MDYNWKLKLKKAKKIREEHGREEELKKKYEDIKSEPTEPNTHKKHIDFYNQVFSKQQAPAPEDGKPEAIKTIPKGPSVDLKKRIKKKWSYKLKEKHQNGQIKLNNHIKFLFQKIRKNNK